jgi:hypothetical protein
MTSPFMTVAVLTVLWLIVVVPMVLRRTDEQARERSVRGFGRAMSALGRRSAASAGEAQRKRGPVIGPPVVGPRSSVFVSGAPVRRPTSAAEEAAMYAEDRSHLSGDGGGASAPRELSEDGETSGRGDMSAARVAMMARRRRSLTILGLGWVITTVLALAAGGAAWVLALGFLAGLVGYVLFLRSQAQRDRDRRFTREARLHARRARGYQAASLEVASLELAEPEPPSARDESVVRIDDDDPVLHDLDTIDLTGLYEDAAAGERAGERRAS